MSSEPVWEDTGIFPNFLAKHTTDTTLAPPSQNSEHLMNVTGIDPDLLSQHTTDVRLLNSPQDKVKSSGPVVSGCNGNSASLQKTHHCGSGNKSHMHEKARKIKERGKKEMKESKRKQSRQEAREREKERNSREQRERCIQGERTPIQESSGCQESSACQCHCIPGMENSMFNCSDYGMNRIQCNKSSHCCVGMHLKSGPKSECNKCCICLEGGCNACLLLCFCHTVHKQCALAVIVNSI